MKKLGAAFWSDARLMDRDTIVLMILVSGFGFAFWGHIAARALAVSAYCLLSWRLYRLFVLKKER